MHVPLRVLLLSTRWGVLALQAGEAPGRKPTVRLYLVRLRKHEPGEADIRTGWDPDDVRPLHLG